MPAMTPEEICQLFQYSMAESNLEAVLSVYDPEAVFLNESCEISKGREGLRQALAPLAEDKVRI
ncbi:MAG TPA: nuclear transport factor 2 family protein [Terriglobales bacterium]|jgi:ketosteroid isomerase-like protein|nr:nuclear transport factor 2 family protein [Terriglobales bacterium]